MIPVVERTGTGDLVCTVSTDALKHILWYAERGWTGLGVDTAYPQDYSITDITAYDDGTTIVRLRKDS